MGKSYSYTEPVLLWTAATGVHANSCLLKPVHTATRICAHVSVNAASKISLLIPTSFSPTLIKNVCNFWHLGTLTLRVERQSATMSKITNDVRLNPVWQSMLHSCMHMQTAGVKGLKDSARSWFDRLHIIVPSSLPRPVNSVSSSSCSAAFRDCGSPAHNWTASRCADWACQTWLHKQQHIQTYTIYSVSQKNPSPGGFLTRFPKWMGIFNQFFTHILHVPFYTRLQIFIQLSPTLTKLCHTNIYIYI